MWQREIRCPCSVTVVMSVHLCTYLIFHFIPIFTLLSIKLQLNIWFQLNTERGSLYRQPQKFVSVDEPFNPNAFNFTKMKEAEKMFELKRKDLKGYFLFFSFHSSFYYRFISLVSTELNVILKF